MRLRCKISLFSFVKIFLREFNFFNFCTGLCNFSLTKHIISLFLGLHHQLSTTSSQWSQIVGSHKRQRDENAGFKKVWREVFRVVPTLPEWQCKPSCLISIIFQFLYDDAVYWCKQLQRACEKHHEHLWKFYIFWL